MHGSTHPLRHIGQSQIVSSFRHTLADSPAHPPSIVYKTSNLLALTFTTQFRRDHKCFSTLHFEEWICIRNNGFSRFDTSKHALTDRFPRCPFSLIFPGVNERLGINSHMQGLPYISQLVPRTLFRMHACMRACSVRGDVSVTEMIRKLRIDIDFARVSMTRHVDRTGLWQTTT